MPPSVVEHAELARLLLPGIGTIAGPAGGPTTRREVGARGHALHRGGRAEQHIATARELGMDAVGLPDDVPHERRRRSWPSRPG